MKFLKTVAALTALPLLAACASNWDVDGAKMAANSGTEFQKELQSEYVRLAMLEKDEADWKDTDFFVNKALAATQGAVAPQEVSQRDLDAEFVSVATAERRTLMSAFARGGRDAAPQAAARAQAGYDCWLQELEENIQQKDVDACRKYYDVNLKEVLAALDTKAPEPAKPAAVAAPMDDVIVYFDFDSNVLNMDGQTAVEKAAKMAEKASVVMVTGHTDTAGESAYNEALALDRATAVANALKASGVNARSIRVTANGEGKTAVDTDDNTREARNRRVEITFK